MLAIVVGGVMSGCFLDPRAGYRPARFHVGPNTRVMSVPPDAEASGGGATGAASRSTSPSEPDAPQLSATSVSMQFTMAAPRWFYAGIEAETGRLERRGSNLAAAYGIVGFEQAVPLGSLGAELAAGWQGVRYQSGDDEHDSLVVEPRVRGQLWIAEQWTLGATLGARLGGDQGDDWMAGAYLGVHSHRF